jgi:predicted Zn finger-like uncharacterized protein
MLIICEDCAKRYNIDESRIKGNRARFTCKECGHIIIVEKSDMTRRLISASYPAQATQQESGTIDLLREFEDAAGPNAHHETPWEVERVGEETPWPTAATKKKSYPVLFYFLLAFLAAFFCTSGVLGYLYFDYIAAGLQKTGTDTEFLTISFLLLALSWAIALGVFFLIARSLAKSITKLKDDATRVVRGEQHGAIASGGAREIRELADVLSAIAHSRK